MTIALPSIEVVFKQLANTLIERSERGIAILIIRDDTDTSFDYKEYKNITALEADNALYTAANYQYIEDVFGYSLNKVVVVRIDTTTDTVADALAIVKSYYSTGWITIADGAAADFTSLANWVKTQESEKRTYKAVVYKVNAPDSKHVVNFYNDSVTFSDDRGVSTGEKYCPTLIGILASCNVQRGSTYFECGNLTKVTEVSDSSTAVNNGQFILFNDVNTVKIALGINSLTTTSGTTTTEDMKYIDIVEAMDLILDDITSTFKDEYLGAYKNDYDNQINLISAIRIYFKELAADDILDSNYDNAVDVDVEAQRAAWIAIGKTAAADWTDQEVKNNAYKRTVFLAGDIKILGAMENLKFTISMM